ncbi:MAG: transketolase [Armatimonadota bacterium]|nr:transketolase [Armatimonadota bacterium]
MLMRCDTETIARLEETAYQIRRLSLEMITYGRWGHIGGAFSAAEILACLYFHAMRIDPGNPKWEKRDRFVLSKAHASPALYAALALRGFFPVEEVYSYCEWGGRLEGHTDMTRTPGLEASGGSLGQGLSLCVGMALGFRFKENAHNRVFCLLGDGECNEGQVWEAAMAAAHYHLDNLIAIVDYNKVMAKGFVWDLMSIEPFAEKWRAFGWEVLEVDGHDIEELLRALHQARYVKVRGKPIVLVAHTVKGRGVEDAEFNYKWHTQAPDPDVADAMLRELARRYGRPEEGYSRLNDPVAKEKFYAGE